MCLVVSVKESKFSKVFKRELLFCDFMGSLLLLPSLFEC